jgi:hypothetical protein
LKVVTKATCITTGEKAKYCTVCEAKVYTEVIPLRGHHVVDVNVQTPATCTEDGVMNQKCDNAEDDEYEACSYTTTRVIPATGHNFSGFVPALDATCLTAGNEAYKYCEACKKYYADAEGEFSTNGKDSADEFTIAALGHDFAEEFTVDVQADCETAGEKSRHCSRCSEKTEETEEEGPDA